MKKNQQIIPQNSFTEFLLYTTPNGKVRVEIFLRDENVWLTQVKIAELFDIDRSVITKHLKNIFESGELQEDSVCAKFAHTAADGKTYQTKFYNLDTIIAIGYHMEKSSKGKNSKIRCIHCQELLKQRRDRILGSHCEYVSGLRRRSGETNQTATCKDFLQVQKEGGRELKHIPFS